MFGKRLRIERNDGWGITMKGWTEEDVDGMLEGFNDPIMAYTTNSLHGASLENELEWRKKAYTSEDLVSWGIFPDEIDGLPRKFIGVTSLHLIDQKCNKWSTGIMIWEKAYWNRGIATLAHFGRTWWAACMLNVFYIHSSVVSGTIETHYEGHFEQWKKTHSLDFGNWPSRLALEKAGYAYTMTEPRNKFILGKWRGLWHLRWCNPLHFEEIWGPLDQLPKEKQDEFEKSSNYLQKAEQAIKNI